MFSNGTEYICFLERECENCPFYVYFEEATEENPVCEVEERIALAGAGEEDQFPYEWLDEDGTMAVYTCRKRMGLEPKVKKDQAG